MPSAASSEFVLPPVPDEQRDRPVAVWREPLVIDTYLPEEADAYPAYLDSRVYQGSSGRVFPLPFIERISPDKRPHAWQAVHLENEWVRVVVLPELGGRIHIGYDKVADYDFFYRNTVIKPALVGLAGPWVSGGVEFNWPQHHRPATFLPTDTEIEVDDDGAVTVWCSDHDPFARMKGMHGIRLRPDSSRVEALVRVQNRTDVVQTFLWWANVAAKVGDDYQSYFPRDVAYVADHARRAVSAFPRADRPYYGVDYPARADREHPDADRLDWYRNIPVPTSYMVTATGEEFFGGYDHGRDAGFVHWAPRELSPGKKQWTWGDAPFGRAWDRNLTDADGPYVELMAGVFTDNQPDFAWLAPGETKTFRQLWYPVRGSGLPDAASEAAAVRFEPRGTGTRVLLAPAIRAAGASVVVESRDGSVLLKRGLDLDPGATVALDVDGDDVRLRLDVGRRTVLAAEQRRPEGRSEPVTAEEPPTPAAVPTIDELHAIATYLLQYRHATRSPEPYWQEALRRDAGDVRSRTALGLLEYTRGRYGVAAEHLEIAVARATRWAPTPRDAEPLYLLGLVEARRGDPERAQDLLARASWDAAWRDAALFALARVRAAAGERAAAITALRDLLPIRPDHAQSRIMLAALLRAQGEAQDADALADAVLALDPLDQWARHQRGLPVSGDAPTLVDVALEYAGSGLETEALAVLDLADAAEVAPGQVRVGPVVAAHRAALLDRLGRVEEAATERVRGAALAVRHVQALRLDDVDALERWRRADPDAAVPALLLGNWYYDRRRGEDAITAWTVAAASGRAEVAVIALRNLGLAAFNLTHDLAEALRAYEEARELAPDDARLLYEYDQLRARTGDSAEARLELLEAHRAVVESRDDLTVALLGLLVDVGRWREAGDVLATRRFQPWEGGEGLVLGAWDRVRLAEARAALDRHDPLAAARAVEEALEPPEALGEGRHELANPSELWFVLGEARAAAGDLDGARSAWSVAADTVGDFVRMSVTPYSRRTVWTLLSLIRLGRDDDARDLVREVRTWLDRYAAEPPRVDFFATSLPSMLLFAPDLAAERDDEAAVVRGRLDEVEVLLRTRDGHLLRTDGPRA